jgi:Family of unknown function (DUF6178)
MSSELPPSDRLSDLLELARRAPDELAARIERLTLGQKVELALRVPPARRLDLLLHARRPREVVRALPDAELYLTVREVGPTDALPLLALASTEQLLHVLDLESWRGDRFDADRAGAWLALVLEADERATTRVLRALDDQVLALVLHDWIRIEPIVNENEMAELGGSGISESGDDRGQVTPDGHYRFLPSIVEHAPAIRRILQLLFVDDRARYDRLLWQALWETSAELEEQALYWRQSRLEEHGYPTPEDALAIYAPPSGQLTVETPAPAAAPGGTPVAILRSPRARTVLVPALDRLDDDARDRVLFEFVALANRVLVADGADAGDPAAHKAALETAAGYVTIALEARDATDAPRAAAVLTRASTIELFREGYARAAELGARARALGRTGWALELLDLPIRETVERLLEPRPRTPRGTAFATLAEIETSRAALEMAEVVGRCILEGVGFDARRLLPDHRLSAALLTLLAWQATRQTISTDPLPPDVASDFLRTIASRRTAAPDAAARALDRLVQRLAHDQRLGARDIAVLQAFGRFCLEQLADECGDLDPGVPLDRRAVACLLLA